MQFLLHEVLLATVCYSQHKHFPASHSQEPSLHRAERLSSSFTGKPEMFTSCLPGGQVKAEKLMTRPKHCKGAGLRQHRKERGKENKNQNQQQKSKPDMTARGATFIQLHGMLFSWMSFNKPKVFHIQLWPILFAWKSMSFFLGQVTEQSPLLVYRGITEQVSPD